LSAQDWAQLEHFSTANKELPEVKSNENRVVFMGNSITIGWSHHQPEFFEGKPYVNRGISGQTTPQMLPRIPSFSFGFGTNTAPRPVIYQPTPRILLPTVYYPFGVPMFCHVYYPRAGVFQPAESISRAQFAIMVRQYAPAEVEAQLLPANNPPRLISFTIPDISRSLSSMTPPVQLPTPSTVNNSTHANLSAAPRSTLRPRIPPYRSAYSRSQHTPGPQTQPPKDL